ncbi:hypothetical protein [Pontibacter oryzae]|uniref:hypothetical protein n=1 Tax=Pontibacter oryzae TaxID=2304593 RepID=UPI0011C3765C|nr:hypothetical protein [Pontibacter oryzae]
MKSRRTYRIVMTIVSFIFAGLNGYRVLTGEYTMLDVFLMVVFLAIGIVYVISLTRKNIE